MAKRATAGILGLLALLGSLLPLGYAYEIFKDFGSLDGPFWSNVLGLLIMGAIATTGVWLGLRFLRFALSGEDVPSSGLAKPILLGIGFFFPGFVFSLPLAVLCVNRIWPSDDSKVILAFETSASIGVIAAITCAALLLRKRARNQVH